MTSARRQPNTGSSRDRSRETDVAATPPSSPPPVHDRAPQTPVERIGDILRRTRQRRGDDLQHIADYLCIRRSYLEAIETSNYDKFPADAYVIGFLRSYADLLGLDGREAINLYRAEMAGRRKKPVLSMPTPMPEGRLPSVFILIGAVITAVLVYALWYGLSTSDRATISTPPALPPIATLSVPAVTDSAASHATNPGATPPAAPAVPAAAPASASTAAASAAPVALVPSVKAAAPEPAAAAAKQEPPAVAAAKPPHLVIRAQQSSWVMIADSRGKTLFDRVLKPGETFKVPDEPGLVLTTGNGAGIVLTLDGVDLPKLSTTAATTTSGILRDIPLDTRHLKALENSGD